MSVDERESGDTDVLRHVSAQHVPRITSARHFLALSVTNVNCRRTPEVNAVESVWSCFSDRDGL